MPVAETFVQALGKDQSTPTPWPEELSGMSMLKTLYLYQEKSVHFVRAFVTMVICKVKRLEKFYIDAGECTLNAAASQPDDEAIERHRDPTKCGGSYYVNNCKPQAKLHPSAKDTYPEPADSEPRCNKTVRARDRKGKTVKALGPFEYITLTTDTPPHCLNSTMAATQNLVVQASCSCTVEAVVGC